MAKEDFKNGAEPMDMDDFPYTVGQKIGNVTILSIIKGDETDSYGGYLIKPLEEVRGTKRIFGQPFIVKDHPFTDRQGINPIKSPDIWPDGAIGIEVVGPVGEPYAQRVTFRNDGEKTSHNLTPAEFIALVKEQSLIVVDEILPPTAEPMDGVPNEAGWTQGDIDFVKDNYKALSDTAMAKTLEKTPDEVKRYRLDVLKLKKNV